MKRQRRKWQNWEQEYHLITNTNLAFLVDLLLTPGGINKEMLTKKAKEELVSVKYINSMVENFHEADDL